VRYLKLSEENIGFEVISKESKDKTEVSRMTFGDNFFVSNVKKQTDDIAKIWTPMKTPKWTNVIPNHIKKKFLATILLLAQVKTHHMKD
jgi:hypothetical protein